ncbi:MAG: aminopeptidase P family protein [Chloroflexi bacterium]|nr:aminopeptidase P family protein [Chloroflexota bacterium]
MNGSGGGPHAARRARAATVLREVGLDALLLSPGSDLTYLSAYRMFTSERLTCLVLQQDGAATLVVPGLEAARAREAAPDLALATWEETDDSVDSVVRIVGRGRSLAVADQMWAAHLLALQSGLAPAQTVPASTVTRSLRERKDAGEVDALRDAAAGADRAYAAFEGVAFAGRAEHEVASDIARLLRAEGHREVHFTIVGSGPNGASPHHESGDRRIQSGDAVVLDFGGTTGAYCSDITRTVRVRGEPDPELARVHDTVRRAQERALGAARSGVAASAVDRAAREVIEEAGYGRYFIHRLGHGIGLDGHEHPYLVAGNDQPLAEGMAFSIEPGIYLPGRFGVRLEDIAVIGASGKAEPLNRADHALRVVD